MDISRRDLIGGGAGLATLGLLYKGFQSAQNAESDFQVLSSKIDERQEYREENGGATIYLGSVDSWDLVVQGSHVYDNLDFEDVERMLEEGKSPEEVVNSDKQNLRRSDRHRTQVIRENKEEIELVYLSEQGNQRPLQEYEEILMDCFSQLDPSVELDVSSRQVEPDEEDLEALNNVSSSGGDGLKADLDLKTKYSSEGTEPVFLLEEDILPGAAGISDGLTGVAFVELGHNEEANKHVINHEAGHSILSLPHHYHQNGIMSYNSDADEDTQFHPRSRMMALSILNGETEYEIKDKEVSGIFDGETQTRRYKQIDVSHHPKQLETPAVTEDFFQHLDIYAEQVLGYDMNPWNPESHEIIEEDGTTYDIATYRHEDGTEMQLKVNNYVEEMELLNQ